MELLEPVLDDYVVSHSEEEPQVLKELSRETWLKTTNPRMIAGHLQGRALSMLSNMMTPKNVLEIGTFTGYSAICIAEGLDNNGMIHTIDINEELETMASKYFEKAGFRNNITQHIGHALDIIPTISIEEYDLVFIDADKTNYLNYYNLVFDKVKKGGYIIADNVLWNGKVIEEKAKQSPDTKTILEYNNTIQNDKRVQNVLFPIRDGLQIARKL
jgi:caffeoyl-CoA O-methyltransferase